ncbi:MAG TPA: LysR family transcriptional regulator [Verrucomicrobiae bacterium]|nr:LysR family transcriptional regulator [Verrucomicrobiae bacterium]
MIKTIEKTDGTSAGESGISLRDLRSFVAVVRAGGVTRAARDLGYAQATLSARIAALESAIGVPLLEPGRRNAVLTEAGRTVLARGELLLGEAAALQREARSTAGHTTVRIAACEPVATYRLPPIVAAFARLHPRVDVELQVAGHVKGPALVEAGEVAFAIGPKPVPTRRAARLAFGPLYDEHMLVLLPKRHRLASAKSVALAELNGESLLVGSDVCAYRALVVGAMQESDVDVALRVRFGDGATLAHGVAAGLGVAVLPEGFFLHGSLAPGIVARPLRRPPIAIGIGLIELRPPQTGDPASPFRRAILEGLRGLAG